MPLRGESASRGVAGLTVLMVDDMQPLLSAVRRVLLVRGCRRVDARTDPRRIFSDCRECRYDVVVLDVDMGLVDGVAVGRALRVAGHGMPILFWTGRPAALDGVLVDLAPASVLGKPCPLDDLVARIAGLSAQATGDPCSS